MKRASKEEFSTKSYGNPIDEPNSKVAASYIRPLKNKYFRMNNTIVRITALIILLSYFSSCYTPIKTDRKTPKPRKYRSAGRYW